MTKPYDVIAVLKDIYVRFETLAHEQKQKRPKTDYTIGTADGLEAAAGGIKTVIHHIQESELRLWSRVDE